MTWIVDPSDTGSAEVERVRLASAREAGRREGIAEMVGLLDGAGYPDAARLIRSRMLTGSAQWKR